MNQHRTEHNGFVNSKYDRKNKTLLLKRVWLFAALMGCFLLLSACGAKDINTLSDKVTTPPEPTLSGDSVAGREDTTTTQTPTSTPAFTDTPAMTATQAMTATPALTDVPTLTATPAPTAPPAPTATPTATPTPTPALTKDDFDAADFFDGAVFSGDSVLSQFYWKVPMKDRATYGKSDFLIAISYSIREGLKPVSDTSIHPIYDGEQRPIWESMKLLGAKRALLFFGLNDIGVNGVDGFVENYKTLVRIIKETIPDIKIYIISTTPMRADMETKRLTNANITAANELLRDYCQENGLGFIDVATVLKDASGALAEEYSDGTNVHETTAAFEHWKAILLDYAKEQLLLEALQQAE